MAHSHFMGAVASSATATSLHTLSDQLFSDQLAPFNLSSQTLIPPSNEPPINALQLLRLIVFTFRGADAAGFQFVRSLDRRYGASQKCYIK
jgi:hypothetical protein